MFIVPYCAIVRPVGYSALVVRYADALRWCVTLWRYA